MQIQKNTSKSNQDLIDNLIQLIEKGNAHASLDDALKDMPYSLLLRSRQGLLYVSISNLLTFLFY